MLVVHWRRRQPILRATTVCMHADASSALAQEAAYPSRYYHDMVHLGWQLIFSTNEFSSANSGSGEGKK